MLHNYIVITLAQEVQGVFPKLVEYNKEADYLEINFIGFIPELVQAIKEQQLLINSVQSEINEIKKQLAKNSSTSKSALTTTGSSDIGGNGSNILYQNVPNPFSQNTTINYFLIENVQKSMICIYDMNGTQQKCIPIYSTGNGYITLNGNELKAGMYMYSLIVDGNLIDTKRMILTN